jgi:hypothetical protein
MADDHASLRRANNWLADKPLLPRRHHPGAIRFRLPVLNTRGESRFENAAVRRVVDIVEEISRGITVRPQLFAIRNIEKSARSLIFNRRSVRDLGLAVANLAEA